MPLHPAWVKNISRRVLWAALEKDISRNDRLAMFEFFDGNCCYCDEALPPRWHADHLLPCDQGGFNHPSNRVPSCPSCNEKEKREMAWQEFLKRKSNGDLGVLRRRKQRIQQWVKSQSFKEPPVTEAQRQAWQNEVDKLAKNIDAAWNRLKNKGV